MKRFASLIIAVILVFCPSTAFAENDQKVVDLAEVLTAEQVTELDSQIRELTERMDGEFDFVAVTTADAEGKTAQEFADDYYDYNSYGVGERCSGVLLLLDLDNREVTVSTTGLAIDRIDDAEVSGILDAMFEGASTQDYYAVFTEGLRTVENALSYTPQPPTSQPTNPPAYLPEGSVGTSGETVVIHRGFPTKLLLIALVISLLAGGGAVIGVCVSYNAKNAPDNYPLEDNAKLNLTQKRDVFLHRHVARTKIQQNDASSGGSTHIGSSGTSHGGGSRGF